MDTSSHGEEAPPPHPTEASVQAADGGDGTAALPPAVDEDPVVEEPSGINSTLKPGVDLADQLRAFWEGGPISTFFESRCLIAEEWRLFLSRLVSSRSLEGVIDIQSKFAQQWIVGRSYCKYHLEGRHSHHFREGLVHFPVHPGALDAPPRVQAIKFALTVEFDLPFFAPASAFSRTCVIVEASTDDPRALQTSFAMGSTDMVVGRPATSPTDL